jgi:malate dehydrogenase
MSKRKKIALIGAGQIGGILALLAGKMKLGDVVMYDVAQDMPQGKALDLTHLAPILGIDCSFKGTNSIEDIAGADLCIVTSGIPRKPGMSRDDLVKTNADIIRSVGEGIKKHAPQAVVIVITNPLDAMVFLMQKITGFPANRVIGMAGVLDTGRYQAHLAEALNVSVQSISAFVLGGHGDDMVPVRSYTTCNGVPVGKLLPAATLDAIEKRVRGSGGEVVALLKTGSAFFSPAAAAIRMAESIFHDQRQLLPVAAQLNGEYGLSGIYLGVPAIIGANGIEKVLEIELSESERGLLHESAERVKGLIALLGV